MIMILEIIVIFVYIAGGWWAAKQTLYANRAIFGQTTILIEKFVVGFVLGWILIPIALIKILLLGK